MIFINNPSKFLENINNSQVAYFYTEVGENSLNIDNINTKLIPINLDNSVNLYEINIFNDYFSNISKIISKNSISFRKCLLVIDRNVPKKKIYKIKNKLKGKENYFYFISASEKNKNQNNANKILER